MARIMARVERVGVDWHSLRLGRELAQERRFRAIGRLRRKMANRRQITK